MRNLKLCLLLAFLVCTLCAPALAEEQQGKLYIQVRETPLKSGPSFVSASQSPCAYGQEVTLLSEQGDWKHVEVNGQQGWLHASSLTSSRGKLTAGIFSSKKVSSGEVALAGKGFGQATAHMARYASGFDALKAMDGYAIPPEKLKAFLEEGRQ